MQREEWWRSEQLSDTTCIMIIYWVSVILQIKDQFEYILWHIIIVRFVVRHEGFTTGIYCVMFIWVSSQTYAL